MTLRTRPLRWALVTGAPGIGKSTAVHSALSRLPHEHVYGFVSDEVRVDGARQGFSIATIRTRRSGTLAAPWIESPARFGTYNEQGEPRLGVDLEFIEDAVVTELRTAAEDPAAVLVLDELGPMQASSPGFRDAIDDLLGKRHAIGSIALAPDHVWLRRVREAPCVSLLVMTRDNRDCAVDQLIEAGGFA